MFNIYIWKKALSSNEKISWKSSSSCHLHKPVKRKPFHQMKKFPENLHPVPANICWSWRRLQHVFSVTILRLPRRLGRQKIVTLKTSWRRLEDMSWRCLEDMSWRPLKNFMETNKIFTGDICTTLKRIQNALISDDWFGLKLA